MQKEKDWKGKVLGILPTFYDEQTKESQDPARRVPQDLQ